MGGLQLRPLHPGGSGRNDGRNAGKNPADRSQGLKEAPAQEKTGSTPGFRLPRYGMGYDLRTEAHLTSFQPSYNRSRVTPTHQETQLTVTTMYSVTPSEALSGLSGHEIRPPGKPVPERPTSLHGIEYTFYHCAGAIAGTVRKFMQGVGSLTFPAPHPAADTISARPAWSQCRPPD